MDTDRRWTDPSLPVDDRVEALLAAMTLEEKVAQLGSVWPGFGAEGTGDVAPMQEVFAAGAGTSPRRSSTASATSPGSFGTAPVSAERGRAARSVELQRQVVDGSRLGIPAIVHEECLTGFTTLTARRSTRPRWPGAPPSTRSWSSGWPRRSARTCARSACTRACRRCWTWSATTAGAGSRRPSARTRTWSARSARRTSAGLERPGSSPPSSTSPATPPPGRRATTPRCRWARGSCAT